MPRKRYPLDVKKDTVAAFEASSKSLKEFSDAIDLVSKAVTVLLCGCGDFFNGHIFE